MYYYPYHRCRTRCRIRAAVAIAAGVLFLTLAGLIIEVAVQPWPQQLFPSQHAATQTARSGHGG